MANPLQKGRKPRLESQVPEDLLRTLDSSAEDLRNNSIEDTSEFLDSMQRRIDEYYARRQAPGSR